MKKKNKKHTKGSSEQNEETTQECKKTLLAVRLTKD